jgi:hypothetical protein
LIKHGKLDPSAFIVDPNTGARVIHYTGHFGKVKPLKTLAEEFQMDPLLKDYYGMTVAHYAGRSGELGILIYLSKNKPNLE